MIHQDYRTSLITITTSRFDRSLCAGRGLKLSARYYPVKKGKQIILDDLLNNPQKIKLLKT